MMKSLLFVCSMALMVAAPVSAQGPHSWSGHHENSHDRCKHGNRWGECGVPKCGEENEGENGCGEEGEGSQPIPEPATLFLVGSGLAAGAAAYRRRKNGANAVVES